MNSKRRVIFSCVVLLMFAVGCDRFFPDLRFPEKTQTGANTFGCIVDGVVWTQYDNSFCFLCPNDPNELTAAYYRNDQGIYQFSVTASYNIERRHLSQEMTIDMEGLTSAGRYELPDGKFSYHFHNSNRTYANVGPGSAFVTITTYDTTRSIMSGVFSGVVYSPETSREIKIEDGRFDVSFYRY